MDKERLEHIDGFLARVAGDPTRNVMLKELRAEIDRLSAALAQMTAERDAAIAVLEKRGAAGTA